MRSSLLRSGAFLVLTLAVAGLARGDEPKVKSQEERFKAFTEMMKEVTLTGHFSILGKKESNEEAYEIKSVKKSEDGDYWLFNARIKYGGKDVPMIFPLEVKWAGNAPVIVMDEVTIPGLGTFTCRVVFEEDRYAGTWSHGTVKGQLWGTIKKTAPKDKSGDPPADPKKQ